MAPGSRGSVSPPAVLPTAVGRFALATAVEAAAAAEVLANDPASKPAYLAFRRAMAKVAPTIRTRVKLASEVIYGPPRPRDEAAGSVGALDAALVRRDLATAKAELDKVRRGLELSVVELGRANIAPGPESATNALSAAAYDLGAVILESTHDLPEEPDAILAMARGQLAALSEGAAALAEDLDASVADREAVKVRVAPLADALDAATTSLDLADRGALVVATGRLGAAIRVLAAHQKLSPRLPYAPRSPVTQVAGESFAEPVSALTLPSARLSIQTAEERRALAKVGERLFADKRLSQGNQRSCASCHDPKRAFADGLVSPTSLDPETPKLRHTPTLLYTPLHAAQLWDGSVVAPGPQALRVIHSKAEMGLQPGELQTRLAALPEYQKDLPVPAQGGKTAEASVSEALVAYEVEAMVPADAPIDRLARGEPNALTADQRRGLDVFAGKGRCARCHIPPFFGGSRPLDFAVPVFAVLGVPSALGASSIDPDRGRGRVSKRAADEHAFKTPTVRDISLTAPYFHNGAYPTLEDVVSFYEKGGGKALGFDVPNQDPEVRPLQLSPEDKRVLLVFLREALLDRSLSKAR